MQMEAKVDDLKKRNVIDILKCSLHDKQLPSSYGTLNEVVGKQTASSDDTQTEVTDKQTASSYNTQNEVRYKLIIDPSEDESITRLFFMFKILKRESTRTYICSDFLGDGQLQKVKQKSIIVIIIIWLLHISTTDKHNSSHKTFSCCWTHCDLESN